MGQGGGAGLAGGVLLDGDEAGHAAALDVLAADQVARALGGDHDDVHVLRGLDDVEMDVEAVGPDEGLAGLEVREDVGLVDGLLDLVRKQDLDDVGLLGGLGGGDGLEAVLDGQLVVGRALALADDDLGAAVAEVLGLGMALAAVADHGHGLPLQGGHGTVLHRIDLERHRRILSLEAPKVATGGPSA
jgi:hypothetical protein